jgi:recombination protein RecT
VTTNATKAKVGELISKVGDRKLTTAQRMNCVRDVMMAERDRIFQALPRHVTPDRLMRVAINCIRKTPEILNCDPASLFAAITESATYGWELGGVLGHAYIVPFGRDAVLVPGYRGLIDLCRRSGQVSTIQMELVHEGDRFEYGLGDDPFIRHTPNDADPKRDSRPITHVYCVVKLRDGGIQRSVWTAAKIDAHKEKYAKAWRKKDSAWQTDWPVMAKKTVIRDMINRGLVPVSAEFQSVVQRPDEAVPVAFVDAAAPMQGELLGLESADDEESPQRIEVATGEEEIGELEVSVRSAIEAIGQCSDGQHVADRVERWKARAGQLTDDPEEYGEAEVRVIEAAEERMRQLGQ